MKNLFLKFSYEALESLCEEKGWRIPTAEELKAYEGEINHDWVWVSDEPVNDNEDGTRKVIYSVKTDDKVQTNKNFMENCIVIKEKK